MNNILLLISLSIIPAIAGMVVTRPFWKLKYLKNEDICFFGSAIMIVFMLSLLILTVILTSSTSNWAIGLLCAPASALNLFIFNKYTTYINRNRCPFCHQTTLSIRSQDHKKYRLHCNSCGIHSEWKR